MASSYTSVTQQSWGSRIKDSLVAAVLGLCLFLAAFPALFLNEGRSVYQSEKLEHGKSIVTSIEAASVAKENEGKLIHLSAKATTNATLTDEVLGVNADNVIKLRRVVEMYQWHESSTSETEEDFGGGTTTTTTYTYSKEWSTYPINSKEFYKPDGHNNPSMPMSGKEVEAQQVTLGQFTLSKYFVGRMNNYQPIPLAEKKQAVVLEKLSAYLGGKKTETIGNYYYVSQNPSLPEVGDLRIQFEVVSPEFISVVAEQAGHSLDAYTTEPDYSLEFFGFSLVNNKIQLFEYGKVTADAMFEHAKEANSFWTWIFRLIGFMMMFIGLRMIFSVLEILAAFIPFFGRIVGFIGFLVALVIAITFSLITIAIAWLFYRPVLSVILIVIAGIVLYLLTFMRKKPEPTMVYGTGVPQPMLAPQQGVSQPMVMPQGVQPLMTPGLQPVMAQQMPMYQAVPQQAIPQQALPQQMQMPMYQAVPQQPVPQQMVMPHQGVPQQGIPQQMVMPHQGMPQQVVIAQPTAQPMVMPQGIQPVMVQPMVMPQGVQQTVVPQNLNSVQGETTAATQQQGREEASLVSETVVPQKS